MRFARRHMLLVIVAGLVFAGAAAWLSREPTAPAGLTPGSESNHHRPGSARALRTRQALEAFVEGKVVDAAGRPVPGATVTITAWPADGVFQAMETAARATSDGSGSFRAGPLAAGTYVAAAAARGFGPAAHPAFVVERSRPVRIELRLGTEGFLLSGEVLDASGGKIPGARIQAQGVVVIETLADDSGAYALPLGPGTYALHVSADGYLSLTQPLTFAGDVSRDFRLTPAARIMGRVLTRADRQPVADASVWVIPGESGQRRDRGARTDDEGRFTFTSLDQGSYGVAAQKGRLFGRSPAVEVVAAGAPGEVEVLVAPAHALAGRVLTGGGEGVASVEVLLNARPSWAVSTRRVVTGPDGRYRFEGLPSGEYRLATGADGRVSSDRSLVLLGDEENVDLILDVEVQIDGHVFDGTGAPVEGAEVVAGSPAPGRRGRWRASSALDGAFRLRGVAPGTVNVLARHTERGFASLGPLPMRAGERKSISLTLGPGATITGVVQRQDGTPIDNEWVKAAVLGSGFGWNATTDAEGRFEILALPAGRVELTARTVSEVVEIAAGERKQGIVLVLPEASKRGPAEMIKGVVVGPDGKLVAGARVTLRDEASGAVSSDEATAPEGTFVALRKGEGPFSLRARAEGMAGPEVTGIRHGTTGVRLSLAPEATITGIALRRSGEPAYEFFAVAVPAPEGSETTDARARRLRRVVALTSARTADGTFTIRSVPPGHYEIWAISHEGSAGRGPVTVREGERRPDLRITLEPPAVIAGRAVDADDGAALAGATIVAMGALPRDTFREHTTDGQGLFTIERVVSGDVASIGVGRTGVSSSFTQLVDIPPGRPRVDVVLRVPRGR